MRIIQSINDLEYLKPASLAPMELIKEIEKDFLEIFKADNSEDYLFEFRLPPWAALFLLEKGDDVIERLNDPWRLEYIEKLKVKQIAHYRCAIRNEHDLQLYYSLVDIHKKEVENWLHERAE